MNFEKYEGTGNDFVILQGEAALGFDPADAPTLCARHTGIGADGVLLILPPTTAGARGTMRVLNADGSEPEMCGNGLRCVALAVLGGHDGSVLLDTGAGAKQCEVRGGQVQIAMGRVRHLGARRFEVPGGEIVAELGDAGNPHAILFSPVQSRAAVGAFLERHPAFPQRTNVEFAEVVDERIELEVWERGVGFTQACGTGACATVVAAWELGLVRAAEVPVDLPGGRLLIARCGDEILMTGPARRVFGGIW